MSNLPAVWTPAPVNFRPIDLVNIRAMCPPEATQLEFDRFIAMCRARGLDPRLGHAYLFILNASDAKKRSCSIVVSERGYLAAADRCRGHNGDLIFKPDDTPARIEYSEAAKDPLTNPLGILSCEVAVFKFIQGEWHRIPERVYWEERAPLKEIWAPDATGEKKPSGKFQLEPGKKNWRTQGRTMIAKCARVAALRLAFPDQFGGLYDEAEMHALEAGKIIDLTPTEIVQHEVQQERMKAIGAHQAVPMIFADNNLVMIPLGSVHDRMEAHFTANPEPEQIEGWVQQNRIGIKQFLSMEGTRSDWLDLKKRFIDPAAARLKEARQQAQQEAQDGQQDSSPADGDRG